MIETLVLAGFLGCLILCLAAGFSLVYALLGGLLLSHEPPVQLVV